VPSLDIELCGPCWSDLGARSATPVRISAFAIHLAVNYRLRITEFGLNQFQVCFQSVMEFNSAMISRSLCSRL
jgi:hypothetical protein